MKDGVRKIAEFCYPQELIKALKTLHIQIMPSISNRLSITAGSGKLVIEISNPRFSLSLRQIIPGLTVKQSPLVFLGAPVYDAYDYAATLDTAVKKMV